MEEMMSSLMKIIIFLLFAGGGGILLSAGVYGLRVGEKSQRIHNWVVLILAVIILALDALALWISITGPPW